MSEKEKRVSERLAALFQRLDLDEKNALILIGEGIAVKAAMIRAQLTASSDGKPA